MTISLTAMYSVIVTYNTGEITKEDLISERNAKTVADSYRRMKKTYDIKSVIIKK